MIKAKGKAMQEITANVSWIAVIGGAVLAFIVGWLWYGPLFGRQWAEGNGVELGSASSMPMGAMATQAIGLLLVAWFVGVTATTDSLWTFILAVIAFGVLQASGSMFLKKPNNVIAIDFGYLIAAAIAMFIVQAVL
jgi:hypothetical protein